MYKPYRKPVIVAESDIDVPEPHISKAVLLVAKLISRLYLRSFIGTARVSMHGSEYLFDSFKRALEKKSRCIVAFRHQNGAEPQVLGWFVIFKLRKLAARAGISFARRPHVIFVHGYEVLRWGGTVSRLVLPRLGALQIHHAKIDSKSMNRIYQALFDGPYPLTIAPEGQVSYFTEFIPRLEPGAIRIGFNIAEQLNAEVPVEVLPVSVLLQYDKTGPKRMDILLRRVERLIGLKGDSVPFCDRLTRCRDTILNVNERRYNLTPDPDSSFEERMTVLIDAAFLRTEVLLGVQKDGEFYARMHALRQICWDRIFIPGVDSLAKMTALERSAADLCAGEAWHAGRHLEMVDFVSYFRVPVPAEDASVRSKVEYIQNLWDFANRTMGGGFSDRISIKPDKVVITTTPPINLTSRLDDYHRNRKDAVTAVLSDLRDAYIQHA
jgi:hypothetical protein